MKSPIEIMLVDDHAVVRAGYRRLLEQIADFKVVAEAGNGEDAYRTLQTTPIDVVILDISMPGQSGLEIVRRLRAQDIRSRVLVFSVHENPSIVQRAFESGANGYLAKSGAADEMIEAVRTVSAGRRYLSSEITRKLFEHDHAAGTSSRQLLSRLTAREFEVLRLFTSGRDVEDIAGILHLQSKTVSNNLTAIRQKLEARNHVDLMRLVMELGLFDHPTTDD